MSTETVIEAPTPSSWTEDVWLVVLFAVVGALGMAVGIAGDSQAQMSVGLILFGFAAKVLADIRNQSSAQKT